MVYRWYYPFGKRDCAMPCTISALQVYADRNGGWFPRGGNNAADALRILFPGYLGSARLLAGVSGDEGKVLGRLRSGQPLDQAISSWVYWPGFRKGDPSNLAVIWERASGVNGIGRRTSPGAHVVGFADGHYDLISGARWDSFLKEQEQIRARVLKTRPDSSGRGAESLDTLLALPVSALARVETGRMNLLCAQGLPGAEGFDLEASLAELDKMATRVRSETERHFYRFQKHPAEFKHSEGFFRMLMLAVVLAEDFRVRYAPGRIGTAADARAGDGFFADAQDVFLQGLLGPRRQGTCSSLPVLQVAVGRRLGYPLKLVTTKGHLFVRWEGAGERFNIEAAGKGVNRFTDDYYIVSLNTEHIMVTFPTPRTSSTGAPRALH